MIEIFLFCCSVIGLTNILIDSSAAAPIRWLFKKILPFFYGVFECQQCMGTWCGLLCGGLIFGVDPRILFLSACAGSFVASFGYLIIQYIETKIIVGDNEH